MPVSNISERITHVVSGNTPLTITTKKGLTQDIIVELSGEGKSEIEVICSDGSDVNLFFINIGKNLDLKETIRLQKDAQLRLSYADFNEAELKRDAEIRFEGQGSNCHLKTAILVQAPKELRYSFEHHARNSIGEMENFAVTMAEGNMKLHAVGHIHKNAALSETHQTTRVLNYNSSNKAMVYPELIIENNDVKASHAQTSGQIDSDHLYYMHSRGLSTNDAIRLIVKGYLSSILDSINDEALHDKLMVEIDQKVDRVCSM